MPRNVKPDAYERMAHQLVLFSPVCRAGKPTSTIVTEALLRDSIIIFGIWRPWRPTRLSTRLEALEH